MFSNPEYPMSTILETLAEYNQIKKNLGVCRAMDCYNDSKCRGLCSKHYARLRKHGDLDTVLTNFKDRRGERNGPLVVLGRADNSTSFSRQHVMWKCQCDCGKEVVIKASLLNKKDRKYCSNSCGLKKKYDLVGNIIADYHRNAKVKNRECTLSRDEFVTLFKRKCFYCGSEPSKFYNKDKNKEFPYNGIDRLNSDIGYVLANCVTCCEKCNRMKGNLTTSEFILRIQEISRNGSGEKYTRRNGSRPKILLNAVRCKKCDDLLISEYRHDFVKCSCGAIFTDGGRDYIRRGGEPDDMESYDVYVE